MFCKNDKLEQQFFLNPQSQKKEKQVLLVKLFSGALF
jgi:hypothetical protein